MATSKIKVLLIDDHAVMRMGLAALLATENIINVVGEAGTGAEGIALASKTHPDVVLMDLLMPNMDGSEATRKLLAKCPGTKVLILTTFGTADGLAHALAAGASGAVLKSIDFRELVKAIRATADGQQVLSVEIRQILSDSPPIPELTPRQQEVLTSMTRGLTNRDIAQQLGICEARVIQHVKTLFAKLGAANRTEAVAIALRKYLLKI